MVQPNGCRPCTQQTCHCPIGPMLLPVYIPGGERVVKGQLLFLEGLDLAVLLSSPALTRALSDAVGWQDVVDQNLQFCRRPCSVTHSGHKWPKEVQTNTPPST